MKRRTVLSLAGAATAGLAGCLADGDDTDESGDESGDGSSGGSGDGSDDSDSDDGTSSDDSTDTNGSDGSGSGDGSGTDSDSTDDGCGSQQIVDDEIRTTGTTCGSQDTDDASMTLEDGSVVVEGTVSTSTPCYDAVLAGTGVEDSVLSVRVDVSERDEVCQQCIGEISYRATVTVDDTACLQSVTVDHVDGGSHDFPVE